VGAVAELGAEVPDVDLDVVLVPEEVVAPYLVENGVARQHLARAAREIQQKIVFTDREVHAAVTGADLAGGRVDAEVADLDDPGEIRVATAKHGANPS